MERVGGASGIGASGPSRGRRRPEATWRRRLLWLGALIALLPIVFAASTVVSLGRAWSNVERESFDPAAFQALPQVKIGPELGTAEELSTETMSALAAEPVDARAESDPYEAYMIVGSDEGNSRADVIIVALVPHDGSAPLMVSLPRDLYLPNRCTRGLSRINANFVGCGDDVNGATQLSGAVEDFTGVEIDHFALFTMDGFERIIDALGGVKICVEHAARDIDAGLDLPAGCSRASGRAALAWVRSRKTQEYVDGRWRTVADVSDLSRNQHQQELILSMFERAASFRSPQELTTLVRSLSDAFTLDDQLGTAEAVNLAWDNRNLQPESVVRMTIPVEPYTTVGGAQVLLPTKPFAEVLADYRDAPTFGW
jgi:LCP family protein required for cell wall assembly